MRRSLRTASATITPRSGFFVLLSCVLALAAVTSAHAQDMRLKGWEAGTEYDKLYIPEDREKFKAVYLRTIDITPMPGMDEGQAVIVEDLDYGDEITVHVGPKDFVKNRLGVLKRGDVCKVYGVWNELDGEEIFVLNKLVCEDTKLVKVRMTRDGMGWWNLSPEDLAKEERDNRLP